jgi:antitoxin MazE
MITRVRKWGNSLGLRIPKSFAKEARMDEGVEVDLSVKRDHLEIRPVRRAQYRLEDLLAGIHPRNLHDEVRTGPAMGRELL